jgi:hypothetical protein
VVHKISSVVENLFILGLVCYLCPGSKKINILTAQYKRISNEQWVNIQTYISYVDVLQYENTNIRTFRIEEKTLLIVKAY